ncbi:DUF951 domain-containing protein [Paenibacillus albicereus]|uniref:DUF951 domain-containing protein n=1 Tax=Paenibacillus albicereus TaxID=2726185 RepID=A0A6H2H318_9BACL|nr:DUF951 domain-containing protein [Paenibacillus albicereus]QJC54094.1 DUF951 domain-containing protein [Paenibacillus albicereus]
MERKQFELGDVVQMKKPHPCGKNEMEVIRMGMDIRIKCVGCKHSVLIPRAKFEKNLKKVLRAAADRKEAGGEAASS